MPHASYGSGTTVFHRKVELRPVGSDGVAAVTKSVFTGPGRVTHIAVDYVNQPATTDITINADGSGGALLWTRTSSATDVAVVAVGTPGAVDEGNAATAATDGVDGGWYVESGLFFTVAEGDGQTSGNEVIWVDVWFETMKLETIKLRTVGADGSAVAVLLKKFPRAGIVKGIHVDYQNEPSTTDLVITADVIDAGTGGNAIFTATSTNTDIGPTGLGCIGVDEAHGAAAATDALGGGQPFKRNLYFDVAQGDQQTSGNEQVVVKLWIQ